MFAPIKSDCSKLNAFFLHLGVAHFERRVCCLLLSVFSLVSTTEKPAELPLFLQHFPAGELAALLASCVEGCALGSKCCLCRKSTSRWDETVHDAVAPV